MKKLSCIFPVIIFLIAASSNALAQSVYFQREIQNPSANGFFSELPVAGPASSLRNIASGIPNTASAGVVSDGSSGFYVSDVTNVQVLRIDEAGNSVVAVSSLALVSAPRGLAFDMANNLLFIMDRSGGQILRANFANGMPATTVDIITSDIFFAGNLVDMHFNANDGYLYWSNNGSLYRADCNPAVSLPVTPELLNLSAASGIRGFDFDVGTPQQIYFVDTSTMTAGIYKGNVPPLSANVLNESVVFDTSAQPSFFISGISISKISNDACFSAQFGAQSFIRCGDRASIATLPDVLTDTGDLTVLKEPPVFIEIAGAVPTSIPTSTPTPQIVRPDTTPDPPVVTVNSAGRKPSALIVLENFSGADTKRGGGAALRALISEMAKRAKKTKATIGFRYQVELKRASEADGSPVKGKKNKDQRSIISKRNELTVKNLKDNSNYNVRYRVEITSKSKGSDLKVVKRTPFSPSNTFTIP